MEPDAPTIPRERLTRLRDGAALGVPPELAQAQANAVGRTRVRRPPVDTSGELADWVWQHERMHERL